MSIVRQVCPPCYPLCPASARRGNETVSDAPPPPENAISLTDDAAASQSEIGDTGTDPISRVEASGRFKAGELEKRERENCVRAVKRRLKPYPLQTKPRSAYRPEEVTWALR